MEYDAEGKPIIPIKDEYNYEEVEEMVATVIGWFSAPIHYPKKMLEQWRDQTAQWCDELAALLRGGCDPYTWHKGLEIETIEKETEYEPNTDEDDRTVH